MLVEQAIFTSTRSKKSQGYHIVARSPGVDDKVWRTLSTWGPSHSALLSDAPEAESYNFHPVGEERYAISRTVHGGPEYSGRGGLEVFTQFLLVQPHQLAGYQNDALKFARTALTLGHLRFQTHYDESLPAIDMPDHPIGQADTHRPPTEVSLQEVLATLSFRNRVAVLGLEDPLPTLSCIMEETPPTGRLEMSFSTGLRPSVDRAFRIIFAEKTTPSLHAQLSSHGIDYVTAT